jgi:hypothetical protein
MISTGDLSQLAILLNILGYTPGGGGGGGVTPRQVQEFAFNYEPATGVDDAFVVNLTPTVTVLSDGLIVAMSSGTLQNLTETPTLQINAIPPTDIVVWDGVLAPGDIKPDSSYLFLYNEALNHFQLLNPSVTTANAFLTQSNIYNSAIDSGSVNAYVVTLDPIPDEPFAFSFPIYMQVATGNDNTGASTLTVNGDTTPIYLANGSDIPAGALVGDRTAFFLYSTVLSGWVLQNSATSVGGGVQSVTGSNVDQVIVDNTDPANPILSLPQDIAPTSSPTFASLTSTNDILVNNKTIGTGGGNEFSNTVFGIEALFSNLDGDNNVAIGDNALRANLHGVQSVAVGVNAAVAATGGLLTAIGDQALADNIAGAANTALGQLSGQGVVSGSYNTSVGAGSGVNDPAAADTLALGANAIADAATGNTSADDGAGIAMGSSAHPVGFRGDGSAYPAGSGAVYWRNKINNTYYKIPLLDDATDLQWPGDSGTLALLSDIPSGLVWNPVSGTSQALVANNGYVALNAALTTLTLPATAALGSVIGIQGYGAAGWVIDAGAGQTISGGDQSSTSGGSVTSQSGSDNAFLLCVVADTEWRVTSSYSQGLNYL